MCRSSIYDARNNFSALVKMAEAGEAVELTRRDKPVAVIISYEAYRERNSRRENWLSEWRKAHADNLLDEGLPYVRSHQMPDPEKAQKLWSEK